MKNFYLLIASAMLLTGCATGYVLKVDSISDKDSRAGKIYYIASGSKDVEDTTLQFKEYVNYIDCALAEAGYTRTRDINTADMVLFLSYGIGEPKETTSSYSIPIFGQTGVSSAYTTGSVSSYGSNSYYSGTTNFTPTYGLKGFASGVTSSTQYFRYLILDSFDLKKYRHRKENVQLWTTKVTSTGSSSDLRTVFPIMVAAAKKYFGGNTGKQLSFTMYDWDPAIKSVKCESGGMISPTASTTSETKKTVRKVYLTDGSVLVGKSITTISGFVQIETIRGKVIRVPVDEVERLE
jgi:hypothetical protein